MKFPIDGEVQKHKVREPKTADLVKFQNRRLQSGWEKCVLYPICKISYSDGYSIKFQFPKAKMLSGIFHFIGLKITEVIDIMDEKYMKRAIELAQTARGNTSPNPMVGAVIVKDGRIIGEGYHERYGELHAERNAFKNCTENPEGAEMYVTLEPCCHYGKTPPCTEAIIENKIKTVYIGSSDPNPKVSGGGIKKLCDNGINVVTGVLKEECDSFNTIFFHYITTGLPYVIAKYACTADGKIATASGDSKWISNEISRKRVHQTRNAVSAIMVGIGTVISDNPMLNCRIENGVNPVRVICDSELKIPLECNILKTANEIPTVIACASSDEERKTEIEALGAEVLCVPDEFGRVDLKKLIKVLGERKIDSVLIEGGAEILGSAFSAGLVNKLEVYVAPKVFGGNSAKTPIGGFGVQNAADAVKLKLTDVSRFEDDVLLEYDVQ